MTLVGLRRMCGEICTNRVEDILRKVYVPGTK